MKTPEELEEEIKLEYKQQAIDFLNWVLESIKKDGFPYGKYEIRKVEHAKPKVNQAIIKAAVPIAKEFGWDLIPGRVDDFKDYFEFKPLPVEHREPQPIKVSWLQRLIYFFHKMDWMDE